MKIRMLLSARKPAQVAFRGMTLLEIMVVIAIIGIMATAISVGVVGYRYPHDDPSGVLRQQYAPDVVVGRRYYEPGGHGAEARLGEVLARLRDALGPRTP